MIQLDVLRGVAILLVLINHSVTPRASAGWLSGPAEFLGRLGWTGVDLFFVLSGFLVGGLLLSELHSKGAVDVWRFIVRRMLKIWPSYYLLVFICLFLDARAASHGSFVSHGGFALAWKRYLPNLLNVQNYGSRVDRVDHTWSLAVEEHFYLALPLLIFFLTARGKRRGRIDALPWIALGVIIACNLLRLENLHTLFRARSHYKPTHLRMDSLAFGVLLAYFYHLRPTILQRIAGFRWTLLLVGIALISPMGFLERPDHAFVWTVGYTLLYVGYGCILVAAVHTPVGPSGGLCGRFFASVPARLIATIGVFSYSIYLWHFDFVHNTMEQTIAPRIPLTGSAKWIAALIIYIAAAFVVGVVMGKLVEFPALAVRDKLFPARAAAMEEANAPPMRA
jgi:peptidoglycan/LPS O-acetylase OafA/YrhL